MASAYLCVLEAVGIQFAGHAPHDIELADRAIRGLLGLPPVSIATDLRSVGTSTPPVPSEMEIPE